MESPSSETNGLRARHRFAASSLTAVVLAVLAATVIGAGSMNWLTPASAHVLDDACTTVGVGIDIRGEFLGTTDEAAVAQVGDVVEYTVTVSLDENQCPITDGEVILTLPDGSVVVLDSSLSLSSGETQEYIDAAQYTIIAADIGTQGAPADFIRASASVTAISHRATGIDQQVSGPRTSTRWLPSHS